MPWRVTSRVGAARALGALCAVVACVKPASANGRFPSAQAVAFDPGDDSHVIVSTTFGLLESRDAGASFSWVCEGALGIAGDQDVTVAITEDGSAVVGTFTGIAVSQGSCGYARAPEIEGEIIGDVALSRAEPRTVYAFQTIGTGAGRFDSRLLRTDDQGSSWTRFEAPLPETLLPLTLDVAPSDPRRVYLSGRLSVDDEYTSALLRSDDGGETFEQSEIPGTANHRLAFIGAVHPNDPDRLYVRVDDPAGTRVLRSTDAGQTFEPVFTGVGRLLGFALSPDGEYIALGGPNDGVWVGSEGDADFERRSELAVSCLGWGARALFACASTAESGFSIGASADEGRTFSPLLAFSALCGATACGRDTPLGMACALEWENVAPRLGATCGVASPGAGAGTGGGGGAAGGPSTGGAAPVSAGGGCAFGPGAGGGVSWFVCALALVAGIRRRWRAPRRRETLRFMRGSSLPGLALVLALTASASACKSDEAGNAASIRDVVYLDATTDEALLALLDAAPVADDSQRVVFDAPQQDELLPSTPPPTFSFQPASAAALPLRDGSGASRWSRRARALGRFMNPISIARAHGAPFNGKAHFLVFSNAEAEHVLRVFTASASYTPDSREWDSLVAARDPLTLEVLAGEFENNRLVEGGGPFEAGSVSFAIE